MPTSRQSTVPSDGIIPDEVRAAVCKAFLRLDQIMETNLGKALSSRPYWTLLVELYLAELDGHAMFQSSLSTGEPASNAHRRSAKLAELGAVLRTPDHRDNRRVELKLVSSVRKAISRAIMGALTVHQALGKVLTTQSSPSSVHHMQPREPQQCEASEPQGSTATHKIRLASGGRIVIPADMQVALGLRQGDILLIQTMNDVLWLRSARKALRQSQDQLARLPSRDTSPSHDLIARRQSEARHG